MITKTGIVATLGPASAGQDLNRQFIENGVTTFRLNFSHGDEPTHEVLLQTIRQVEGEFPHAVAVMGDLSGPKIRIGSIEPDGGLIREGDQIIISREEGIGTPGRFSTNYSELTEDVWVGQRILLDDGNLVLRAEEKMDGCLLCRVIVGGPLHSRKGINLPDTEVMRPDKGQYNSREGRNRCGEGDAVGARSDNGRYEAFPPPKTRPSPLPNSSMPPILPPGFRARGLKTGV